MSNAREYVVVGIDVVGYTNNSLEQQKNIQVRLDDFLHKACKALSINPHWIDLGDGGFFLIEGTTETAVSLILSATTWVYEDNKDRVQGKEIDLRFAIHTGQVLIIEGNFGKKYVGDTINNCARLMSGMGKNYKGQVVCSGEFKQKMTAFGGAPTVTFIRLADITDKHGRVHEVWNIQKDPGFGVKPESKDCHDNPLEWSDTP